MKWYWKVGGGHTHVRVFMNGAKCGDLCSRNEEFERIRHVHDVMFDPTRMPPDGLLIRFFPDEVCPFA